MADLSSTISGNATSPQQATADGLSVVQNRVGEVIQADQYLAAKAGARTKRRGVRFTKMIAAGPVSDSQGTGIQPSGFSQII